MRPHGFSYYIDEVPEIIENHSVSARLYAERERERERERESSSTNRSAWPSIN